MNLESEIRAVRSRLGEPKRSEPESGFILDSEIVTWLHQGELRVLLDFPADALVDVQSEASSATVNGTDSYPLPNDFVRLLGARLDSGWGLYPIHLVDRENLYQSTLLPAFGVSPRSPFAAIVGGQLLVRPIPGAEAGAGKLKIQYLAEPARRYKHLAGYTTGAGSTTSIVDGSAVGPNDYWKDCNLRVTSEALEGEERLVSAYVTATHTYTVAAFSAAPGIGVTYEVGEVSALPDEFNEAWIAYAAYRALSKDRETDLAQIQLNEYQAFVKQANARFGGAHLTERHQEGTP